MEPMQLEMFIALVQEGSLQGAAERVFRSQPAVSVAIKKLEEKVASPLFDRSRRRDYSLTPAGELLYSYANRLVDLRREAVSAMEGLRQLKQGELRIGAIECTNSYLLPRLTRVFRQRYSSIRIELLCDHNEILIRQVKERRLDLAVLDVLPKEHELEVQPLLCDQVVLVVSPQHRFAQKEHAHITELECESMIFQKHPSTLREHALEAFKRFDIPFHVSVESATIDSMKKMVAENVGVAFVPLMCVREEVARGELIIIRIDSLKLKRILWAVRRREGPRSHATEAFMRVVKIETERLQSEQPAFRFEEPLNLTPQYQTIFQR
jgi:DNA-binding transcriptional LysR family regulator